MWFGSTSDTVKLEEKIVAAVLNALSPPVPLVPALHPVGLKGISAQTPYSLNWEFVNSQNKVSDVFDLNMRRICGGNEWIF